VAEALWRTLDEIVPGDRWARHGLGVVLMRRRNFDESGKVFSALVEKFPEYVAAWRGFAQLESAKGLCAESLKYFERAAELDAGNIANRRDCVAAALRAQRWERAEFHLERLKQARVGEAEIAELSGAVAMGRRKAVESIAVGPPDPVRLAEAERLFAAGDAPLAEDAVRRLLEEAGATPRLTRLVGLIAAKLGRYQQAAESLESVRNEFPDDFEFWQVLGESRLALRQFAAARDCLERAVSLDRNHAAARLGLGRALREMGDCGAALSHLRFASAARPQDLSVQNDLGHCLRETGALREAEGVFLSVLERDRRFFHALRGMALMARARGDRDAERAFFQKASDTRPDDLWMRWELANLSLAEGAFEAARHGFEAILARDSAFVPAHRSLAALERQRGDEAKARRVLDAALTRCPGNPWLILDQAQHCARARRFGEAESLLTALAREDGPCALAAALELFYCRKAQGRDRAAMEILGEALQRSPDDASLLIARAWARLADGEIDHAERIYRELETRPGNRYWPLVGLGQVARLRGDDQEAAQFFLAAIEASPERPQAYGELNELSGPREARARACDRLHEWSMRRPDDIEPRRLRARYAATERDFDGAAGICADILDRWPDDVSTMLELARFSLRRGETRQAAEWSDRAAAVAPNHASVLEMQALWADWSDEPERALKLYDEALRSDPARHWIALARVRMLFALGRQETGLAELETFRVERGESADYFFTLVEMLKSGGDLKAATAAAESGRKTFPRNARLQVQAALLDVELGRFERARERLSQAAPLNSRERAGLKFAAGMSCLAQWRLKEAKALIGSAENENPDDGWILDRLIHAELIDFDLEKAGGHLRQLARLNRGINHVKGVSDSPSQSHYGQLFDEFRLDRDACAQTREALELEDGAKIETLRGVVRAFRDYTPGAIALLIALRQTGAFRRNARAAAAQIPFALTQFWDRPELPRDLETYALSWRLHNPGLEHRRMDEAAARTFFREIGRPDALRAFNRAAEPAMKADIFRLGWLSHHGGAYADCDDRCQTDLSPLFADGAELVLYQEDIGSIGNNFMACSPGHPMICAAFDAAVRAVNGARTEILWLATGPGLVTRSLGYWLGEEGAWRERAALIRVLDRHEMLGFAAIHCISSYKRTERHWSRAAFRASARSANIHSPNAH
jgi:tetratricopeptide (TPR) repeat protein